MLTPLEITKKSFPTVLAGGYSKREVDNFIKIVRADYEELYKNVIDLRDENNRNNLELERYRSTSEQLQKALTLAQKTADEIKLSAERQADLNIMQANIKAEQIINNSEDKLKTLNKMYKQFSAEFYAYLETFLKLLSKLDMQFDTFYKAKYELPEREDKSESEEESESKES